MPAASARSAIAFPTRFAASTLPPVEPRCSFSARHFYHGFRSQIISNLKSEITNQLLTSLPRFQLQLHIGITDALAFVGVGLSQLVHFRAHLAEPLFVDAGNRQSRLILLNISFGRQAFGFGFDAFR